MSLPSGHQLLVVTLSLAGVIMGAMVWLGGCSGPACDEMGCSSALSVEFPDRDWESGEWTMVTLTEDDEVARCEVELPVGSTGSTECETFGDVVRSAELDKRQVGVHLPAMELMFAARYTDETVPPSTFTIRLRRGGQTVSSHMVDANYDDYRPNGPGCDPLCHQATVQYQW